MGMKDKFARQMAKAGYKKAKAVEQANSELAAKIPGKITVSSTAPASPATGDVWFALPTT